MMKLTTRSISFKFVLVLLLVIGLTFAAGLIAARQLRLTLMRGMAQAVTDHVVSFRSWVADSGGVWVNAVDRQRPDYLRMAECGGGAYYLKNPALATRELSNVVQASGGNATFRVTSDNYRNPKNAPDSFEAAALFAFKTGQLRSGERQLKFVEQIEGSSYRYAVPIAVQEACLGCHGRPADAPREVVERYGGHRAFGYRTGDIRGIISVELPVVPLYAASPLAGGLSAGLVALAFLLNYLLLKRMIIDRIVQVTEGTEAMARGDLDIELSGRARGAGGDEIDHLAGALELMRRRLKAAQDGPKH